MLLDKCFCYHFFLYQCFKICLRKLLIYFQELRGGLYNKHYPNDLTHNVLSHKHYYNDISSHKHYYNDVLSHRQDNIIGNLFSMQVATLAVVAILLNYAGMVLLIYISCNLGSFHFTPETFWPHTIKPKPSRSECPRIEHRNSVKCLWGQKSLHTNLLKWRFRKFLWPFHTWPEWILRSKLSK